MTGEYVIQLGAGTPQTGLWCDTCNLPSRIVVPVMWLADSGVGKIGESSRCAVCSPA